MVLKKGYQSTEEVSSIITTKVKGQGYISQDGEQPPKEADITDPIFFEKLNYIDPDKKYREFDTAGIYKQYYIKFFYKKINKKFQIIY